ncbi:serine/threonine-protein kinase BSK1-like [Dioscorea cayenensis subsp. rotundata]|uniref:Serine/threonine-protein kinase BSK1-like n=1 Tax=Dioscorea cayennensis subsp. rotundata TaxID=55577 RepID=A0AB40CBU3_DIOCR|nr:serine/threonine-protein kinase BSK1-like [Dioscorea cayenensis subsp. rotundata]
MGCCFSTAAHQPKNHDSDNDEHNQDTNVNPAEDTNVNPAEDTNVIPTEDTNVNPAEDTNVIPTEVMALSEYGWNYVTEQHQEGTTPFRQYTLQELMAATDGFSEQKFLSKGDGEIPNNTYSGLLPGGRQIAVKNFSLLAWPDEEQFKVMAIRGGRLRHRRLVNLIGYCCDDDERLLVAEFMPNDSLATYLSNPKKRTMEWSMRLRVARYIAEALEYCINEAQTLYFDLNPNKVLFDEADNPCLSCFGLAKNHMRRRCYRTNISYTPPECITRIDRSLPEIHVVGMIIPESMIYSFGIMLRDLLSGKQILGIEAVRLILGKKIPIILDSRLNGEYSIEEETALVKLAHQCLEQSPTSRPTITDVIATFAQIQSNNAGPSNSMPGIDEQDT